MANIVSKLEPAPRPEWSSFLLLRLRNVSNGDFISFAITKKAGTLRQAQDKLRAEKGAQIIPPTSEIGECSDR